jgi:hypothetical protein
MAHGQGFSACYSIGSAIVSEYIKQALPNLQTRRRKLRVLEIGAGTYYYVLVCVLRTYFSHRSVPTTGFGTFTRHVVCGNTDLFAEKNTELFIFTDISEYFLKLGKENFTEYNFMQFKILDIETQPALQGFLPHSFDIGTARRFLLSTSHI